MVVVVEQIWDRAPNGVWAYLVVLISVYVLYSVKNYLRSINCVLKLNGPPTTPIIGNAYFALDDKLCYKMSQEAQLYGPIFRIWLTLLPCVVLLEPEDIQVVLGSAKHTRKIFFYKLLDNFLGKGLITRDVETWRIHRKLLQPAFHLQFLEKFTTSFAECADTLANKFLEMDGRDINFTSLINDAVYEILSETVLGIPVRSSSYVAQNDMPFRKGQLMIPHRLQRPWLIFDWIYRLTESGKQEEKQRQDLSNACFRMMEEKRKMIHSDNDTSIDSEGISSKRISLLEYMVEVNEKNPYFTDEDIVEECCTFMLAGQDSVGTATAMTLFLLAKHPEWQDKCVDELEKIFGDDSRSPTMKDLREMKIIEMCIKESIRLYPSVPIFARVLGENVKIGEHIIPEGCSVVFLPYATHRLPHHFPEPHSFKPERFDSDNTQKLHPYAYLPFSAGPRNCIGYKFAMLEMKCIVSAILRKCQLQSIPGKDEVRPKFRLTVRAKGGLWVKVIARDRFTSHVI